MKVIIGCDHGGFGMKEALKSWLKRSGYKIEDVGAKMLDPKDDYTDFAFKVAEKVAAEERKRLFQEDVKGLLLCRSAAGMVIAANKVRGVRAVAAFDEQSAKHSREHNAANVLALSGGWLSVEQAKNVIKAWLETPFSNEERHARRLEKIADYEKPGK